MGSTPLPPDTRHATQGPDESGPYISATPHKSIPHHIVAGPSATSAHRNQLPGPRTLRSSTAGPAQRAQAGVLPCRQRAGLAEPLRGRTPAQPGRWTSKCRQRAGEPNHSKGAQRPGKRLSLTAPLDVQQTKKPDLLLQIGNGNAAATYSPGPSPAKYHRRAEA